MGHSSSPDLPFSLLVLAPCSSEPEPTAAGQPLLVDPLDIDQALATLAPSCFLSLEPNLCPARGLQLQFHRLRDFSPDGLIQTQPYIRDLMAADQFCRQSVQEGKPQQEILKGLQKWPDLPRLSLFHEKKGQEEENPLDNILSMVDLPDKQGTGQDTRGAQPDSYEKLASLVLGKIFHDPTFRALESCWQGIRFTARFMKGTEGRLFIFPVSTENLPAAMEELKSWIFASPPSLILIDQAFTCTPASIQALDKVAGFAWEMLVPALCWIDAPFFQIENWQELDRLSFLPHHLERSSFTGYRRLQESEQGRWLALCSNRFLSRFAYGPENQPRSLPFRETDMPWRSPVWAFAALMALQAAQTGWTAGIASPQYLLKDLALFTQDANAPTPLEIHLSEDRADQFLRCGIMPLVGRKGTDTAFLAGDTMVSADVSLSYQILVSRLSYFILWCRDQWPDTFEATELAEQLHSAFSSFAEQEGLVSVGELSVTCTDNELGREVSFRWKPSRKILPGDTEITVNFLW